MPVSPTFFVKFAWLTYLWNPAPNSLLQSGSQATYEITAPDALSAVPEGDMFHVIIYDGLSGQLLGESLASKATIPTPPIANPSLKWWALEPSVGKKIPFGWKFSPSNTDLFSSHITPLGYNGTSGFQMILNYTSTGIGSQQMILSQKTLLNETAVGLHFNQSFTTSLASGLFFAAGVTDGTHTLYYVFSNRAAQRAITQFSTNTTIIVPITGSQWNNATLSPQPDWTSQGWIIPQQVTISFFLASESPGIYSASIASIDPA
jgi:hypothetical protein